MTTPKLSDFKKIEVTNHTKHRLSVTACTENGKLYIWISDDSTAETFELLHHAESDDIFSSRYKRDKI